MKNAFDRNDVTSINNVALLSANFKVNCWTYNKMSENLRKVCTYSLFGVESLMRSNLVGCTIKNSKNVNKQHSSRKRIKFKSYCITNREKQRVWTISIVSVQFLYLSSKVT